MAKPALTRRRAVLWALPIVVLAAVAVAAPSAHAATSQASYQCTITVKTPFQYWNQNKQGYSVMFETDVTCNAFVSRITINGELKRNGQPVSTSQNSCTYTSSCTEWTTAWECYATAGYQGFASAAIADSTSPVQYIPQAATPPVGFPCD